MSTTGVRRFTHMPVRARPRLRAGGVFAGAFALIALGGIGCRLAPHQATVPYVVANAHVQPTWSDVLAHPVQLQVDTVVGASWAVPRKGLINLDHPEAKAAGLRNGKHPIVVATHVIRHPTAGDFLVDTGIDAAFANGTHPAVKGLVRVFTRDMQAKTSVDAMRRDAGLKISGVLLTHAHLDHVLGLPDIPLATPIYTGPGELAGHHPANGLLRRTYRALFDGRVPVREFQFQAQIEGIAAVDILGDGSIWALLVAGHTAGSVAYLVNATSGPVLLVGDTSHTQWGWDHGVEPGTYTDDHEANRASLEKLRRIVRANPTIRVVVGHELGPTQG